jgi:hypothetical protein
MRCPETCVECPFFRILRCYHPELNVEDGHGVSAEVDGRRTDCPYNAKEKNQ